MSYPVKFRQHVLQVKEREGLSFAATAARFSIGLATLKRWAQRIEPRPYTRKTVRRISLEALADDVKNYPDDYQYERAARFGICQKAIWQALKKLDVTYKKSIETPEGKRRHTAKLSQTS